MHVKKNQSDFYILVLARVADSMQTLLNNFLNQNSYTYLYAAGFPEVILQLQNIPQDRPVILITRPAMLANSTGSELLGRFSNIRLIGWIGPHENPADKAYVSITGHGLIMVSSIDQLRRVIQALTASLHRKSEGTQTTTSSADQNRILHEDYRLTGDELNALLGAG